MRGKGTRRKPAERRGGQVAPPNPPVPQVSREVPLPPVRGMYLDPGQLPADLRQPATEPGQPAAPQTREPFIIALDRPYAIQRAIRAALDADDARLARLGAPEYQLSEDRVRPMIEAAAVVIAEDTRQSVISDFAAGFGTLLDELGKGAGDDVH